jgi:xanthine phosphoribosyltransferase
MTYYPYEQFVKDVKKLVEDSKEYKADTLVAIARGGLTLGHAYASATNNRELMSINSILYEGNKKGNNCQIFNVPNLSRAKKVLILDDIIDSGQTLKEVLKTLKSAYPTVEFKVASIYYKKTALVKADFALYEACDWIEFFWEKDYL